MDLTIPLELFKHLPTELAQQYMNSSFGGNVYYYYANIWNQQFQSVHGEEAVKSITEWF